jgi:hypothetical protein
MLNGVSCVLVDLEGFLNRIVRHHAKQLPDDDYAELKRDAERFCWQEGRHTRVHMSFNELLYAEPGYEWLKPKQAKMKADYARFARDKGYQFCMAYCEGFETYGTYVSYFFFEGSGSLMKDWDEPTIYLWLWHMAEEYEHRNVCNHLYRASYGEAYWMRMYGLWFATVHLFGFSVNCARKFVAADLKHGRIKGRVRSRLRFARDAARLFAYVIPRQIFLGMRPGYDPADIPPPRRCMEFLAGVAERYGVKESV